MRRQRTKCRLSITYLVSLLTRSSSIGAYFGELARALRAKPGGGSVSPFVFLQAFGTLFKDKDTGIPLDGGSSQDTSQFVDELLERLHEENRTADAEKPSLVQDLFNVQKAVKVGPCRRKSSKRAQLTIF